MRNLQTFVCRSTRPTCALLFATLTLSWVPSNAEVTLANGKGPIHPTNTLNYIIKSSVGTIDGNNLFHDFLKFDLSAGERATFTGPRTILNIVSRVTGGTEASSIDGLIDSRTYMPSANFFLLNPHGVMFGPNATLYVGGSFHATTADSIRFAEGNAFSVGLSGDSKLTTPAPAAFGFLDPGQGKIEINGSKLAVASGRTLSFVGGTVQVNGGMLQAPGGRLQLINARSAEVPLEPPMAPLITTSGLNSPKVVRALDPGVVVVIRSGQLLMDGASIVASTRNGTDQPHTGIDVDVDGSLLMRNEASIKSPTSGTGRSGNIFIKAGALELSTQASIQSSTIKAGAAGTITINAESLTMTDPSNIRSSSDRSRSGAGGEVIVTIEKDLSISNEAAISTVTNSSEGEAGDVKVTVKGSASVTDHANVGSFSFSSAAPGVVTGDFGSLRLSEGGYIQAGTFFAGRSLPPSKVSLTVGNSIVISGGAGISSQAVGKEVGDITIKGRPQLSVDNGYISTSTIDDGKAGDILLDVSTVSLTNGGQIASGSLKGATGRGGNIKLIDPVSVTISGGSPDEKSPIPAPFDLAESKSGIFTTAEASGPGGDIIITARQLDLRSGAKISASSEGSTGPAARAGNIGITFADTLRMDESFIATSSKSANGGDIVIRSTGSTLFLNGSQITTSVEGGRGSGGRITLGSPVHPLGFLVLSNSQVQADAFGGDGGNINVFTDVYLKSPNSTVSAFSAQSTAGTINIEARVTDLSGSLAELPSNLLQGTNLLRSACTARIAEGKASSLVVARREGVPPEPDGLLSSPLGSLVFGDHVSSDAIPEDEPFMQSAGVWIGSNCTR
jgi:filamentous hemagglutinin family protein